MNRRRFFSGSSSGSVLMEFVIVLPLYITALGAIFWIGHKSLYAVNLRPAGSWCVWSSGRYSSRPEADALLELFPGADSLTGKLKRSLYGGKSYLEFAGALAELKYTKPDFIDNWQHSANSVYGEESNYQDPDETVLTSSNHGKNYTNCLIMRTKGSIKNVRLLNSGRLAVKKYWQFFPADTARDQYPEKWETGLLDNAGNTSDDFTDSAADDDRHENLYTRTDNYVKWSQKKEK